MSRDVFLQHIKPALDAHPDMVAGMGYEAFEYAAGMVQSRTFSINKENFITGESTEGRLPCFLKASCSPPEACFHISLQNQRISIVLTLKIHRI